MKYLETRKLFLFNMVNEYLKLLDYMEEDYNHKLLIEKVNKFFSNISKSFVEIIFKIVVEHTSKLELNFFGDSRTIGINHIKNIYRGIISNSDVKKILENINVCVKDLDCNNKFEIKKYGQLVDLIEELDFLCMFELYSYLLGEDVEGVLSFILNKITEDAVAPDESNADVINERVMYQIESKIRLFKKLYDDEDIDLVEKNEDHIIYEINDVLKIVYI